jgi:hypothetical protein
MKQCYWADLRTLANENNVIKLWKKMTVLDAVYGVPWPWSSVNPVMLV